MPKIAKKLSINDLKKFKTDGMYAVGGVPGLYFRIVGNSRSWVLNIACGKRLNKRGQVVAKRLNIGLGSLRDVTIHQAREQASLLKTKVRLGINPLDEKRQRRRLEFLAAIRKRTFSSCAEEFIATKKDEWQSEKHTKQWVSTLKKYVEPYIGHLIVNEITVNDVLSALNQPVKSNDGQTTTLWLAKTETATRIRGRIETILAWATARGYRNTDNAASWEKLKHILPSPGKIKIETNFYAMHFSHVPTFVCELYKRVKTNKNNNKYRALLFTILTVGRSSEITGSKRSELKEKLWKIPKERMKSKRRGHTVPLTASAYSLIPDKTVSSELLFPSPTLKSFSDGCLLTILREMGYERETVHGFRSSFKDWARTCQGTNYADEVSELCLSHVNSDATRAAYARDQLLTLRANLLEEWCKFCLSQM